MREPGVTSWLQQIPREVSLEPTQGHQEERRRGGMNDWGPRRTHGTLTSDGRGTLGLQGVRTSQTRPGSKGDSLTLLHRNKYSQLVKRKMVSLDHSAGGHSLRWINLQYF